MNERTMSYEQSRNLHEDLVTIGDKNVTYFTLFFKINCFR